MESLALQVAARTQHSDSIKVENWTPASQRFRAIPSLDNAPPATSFTGPDIIAVPAHGSTAWAFKFTARAEGTATGRVTFRNDSNREYRFWNVTFKVYIPDYIYGPAWHDLGVCNKPGGVEHPAKDFIERACR